MSPPVDTSRMMSLKTLFEKDHCLMPLTVGLALSRLYFVYLTVLHVLWCFGVTDISDSVYICRQMRVRTLPFPHLITHTSTLTSESVFETQQSIRFHPCIVVYLTVEISFTIPTCIWSKLSFLSPLHHTHIGNSTNFFTGDNVVMCSKQIKPQDLTVHTLLTYKYTPVHHKVHYQAFWGVLIGLIVELLDLIIKPFEEQTESWNPVSNDLIIKSFDTIIW